MNFVGEIKVPSPFFLAPMAGVTDAAFRTLCGEYGAALTYTEMVSARALYHGDKKTAGLLRMPESGVPCMAQLFGNEPEILAAGAKLALAECPACGIDINMGCPMPKIVKNGDGCALMRDTGRITAIVEAVTDAVPVPVTVKIRAGFDADHINAVEAALAAEKGGAAAIGVHGRTGEQLYTGTSSREIVAAVKKAVAVPVIASGDIFTAEDAVSVLRETGADFVMIARGARGNPFIFSQANALLRGETPKKPTAEMLLSALIRQTRLLCEEKGEEKAMPEMRKHALWYLGRLKNVKALKVRASLVKTEKELSELCAEALLTAEVRD